MSIVQEKLSYIKNKYPPKICNFCRSHIELNQAIYMYLSQSFCSKKCRNCFYDNTSHKELIKDDQELIKDDPDDVYFNDCYLQ